MRQPVHPDPETFQITDIFHALSDPVRLQIVQALAKVKEESCGSFNYSLTKGTISHHFKVLREAGVTYTRIEGKHRYMSLRRRELDERFPGLLDVVLREPRR